MANGYDVVQAGAWADLGQHRFQLGPDFGLDGKLFLGRPLGLSGAEVSLNRFPAGAAMPFFHRHRENEELYVFVGGEGEMQVGDDRFPVREGTVVRVAPEADRIWRNVSDRDLYFVCVQYRAGSPVGREGADGEMSPRRVAW